MILSYLEYIDSYIILEINPTLNSTYQIEFPKKNTLTYLNNKVNLFSQNYLVAHNDKIFFNHFSAITPHIFFVFNIFHILHSSFFI